MLASLLKSQRESSRKEGNNWKLVLLVPVAQPSCTSSRCWSLCLGLCSWLSPILNPIYQVDLILLWVSFFGRVP